MEHSPSESWIGARLLRKEDARYLRGAGAFVDDIRMAGLLDVAFVRSPVAHGRLRRIGKPEEVSRQRIHPRRPRSRSQLSEAGPELAAFRASPYPPLADDRVRYVGQTVAACVASSRAAAEDLATRVVLDIDELPAVTDCVAAMRPGSPRLFDNWPDNAYITATMQEGDVAALASAPLRLRRQFRTHRQATASMECRGALAYWDARNDELVIYLSSQGPHVIRIGLAKALSLPEHKLRIIAPDVGGGFGGKNRLMPEDIAVAAIALKLRRPVRWIEDRREHLISSVHSREHAYDLTLSADASGRLLGIEGDLYIDAGAYALWPTGGFMDASMAARNLPGPYCMGAMRINTWTVATNKAPLGPYRAVARPGACFALERLVDEMARELRMEPIDLRRRNIVTARQLPYRTAGGMMLDTGDYLAVARYRSRKWSISPALRRRQAAGEPDGRAIGVGFAFYTEQSGHGQVEWIKRKSRVVPGLRIGDRAHAARRLGDHLCRHA